MSMSTHTSHSPDRPYRVIKRHDRFARPLTKPQERVLAALVHLCPGSGSETTARAVALSAGTRHGSVVLMLRNLEQLRLAIEHEDGIWSPTGLARARFRSRRPL
jgi:hypothetical protein